MIVIDIDKTGENIRNIIKETGLSQKAFCRMIGTDSHSVSCWINGEYLISASNLLRISVECGIPMGDILSIRREDPA